jgi:hypothetical protein
MKVKYDPKKNTMKIQFSGSEREWSNLLLVFIDKDAVLKPNVKSNNFTSNLMKNFIKEIILDLNHAGITKEAILGLLPTMLKN